MKSPVLHLATLPLARIEDQWRVEFEQDKKNFEREQGEAELRCQVWRERAREAMRKHLEPPEPPDEDLNEPVQKRLITTDATFEKLHSILAHNPAGIVVVGDELTGWLAELERTGRDGICASSPIHGGGFLRRSPPGSEDEDAGLGQFRQLQQLKRLYRNFLRLCGASVDTPARKQRKHNSIAPVRESYTGPTDRHSLVASKPSYLKRSCWRVR